MIHIRKPSLNRWWGRLGGTAAGAAVSGSAGALAGFVLGRTVDLGLLLTPFRSNRWRAVSRSPAERDFLATLFACAGELAKADGRVSEREIAAARSIMDELGLDGKGRRLAIDVFSRAKRGRFPRRRMLLRLHRRLAHSRERQRRFLRYLVRIASADGLPEPPQYRLLRDLAAQLGLDAEVVDTLLRRYRERRPTARTGVQSLAEAYRILAIAEAVSDGEVRAAYRRLISRHHPDRIEARGGPAAEVRAAAERTREIRSAYEVIRQLRGF